VKTLAEKGDWLRAARYSSYVKKSKGTVPVPVFSGIIVWLNALLRAARYSSYVEKSKGTVPVPFFSGIVVWLNASQKGGQAPSVILGSWLTIWPIPLGASPPFCDFRFQFEVPGASARNHGKSG
jgi:hypothetical protein